MLKKTQPEVRRQPVQPNYNMKLLTLAILAALYGGRGKA